jgi:hypothetical protein
MTKPGPCTGWPLASMPLLLALVAAGPDAAPGRAAATQAGTAGELEQRYYVVLRFAAGAGRRLGSERWRAVAEALSASADAGGAIVCRQGVAATRDPGFDGLCAGTGFAATPLWWDATLALRPGDPTTATMSLQLALGEAPPARAPALFAFGPVVVPVSGGGVAAERAALVSLAGAVGASPEVRAWIKALAHRPGVMRVALPDPLEPPSPTASERVGGGAAPDIGEAGAAVSPAAEEAPAAVTVPLAAAPRSSEALELPPGTATPELRDENERTGTATVTFSVRQAVVGTGFGVGMAGRLAISPQGISLTTAGHERPNWNLPWRELASAARDGGIWEVPFVLVLRARDGSRRYLAQVDARGRYVSGQPILEAIAARARVSRRAGERPANAERARP